MSTATLTSLAMLKINIDQGRDYLDYLRPFVLQSLAQYPEDAVTDARIQAALREQFGLEIPERAVQVVLRRLSKQDFLKREQGVYRVAGQLPDSGLEAQKANADRHIRAVVDDFIAFTKGTTHAIDSESDAVEALCAFLSEFDIPCLRAYLRGTAIPDLEHREDSAIVLVSEYVLQLQRSSPERFESFLVLVQGHMLANALLCPDLQTAPKSYKGVTFYLDTPLLVRRLGLEGTQRQAAVAAMITLVQQLGASVAVFGHSRQELERVIRGAASFIESPDGRGAIVTEARRDGRSKSDLLLFADRLDDELKSAQIEVKSTPPYSTKFQIDEAAFETSLQDEVSYLNPRALDDDVNSVRSIYVLRSGTSPVRVESCKAVLVSSNSGFARAAFEYGQRHEETREVSSVITDFSLANMAWLKAPMGAPSIPAAEVLAFSYAALQPTKELLSRFLSEVDKLEKQGRITERDHQLLRSSTLAQDELVRLTLGDEEALTEATVSETLRRVTDEIKKEEAAKLSDEARAHADTQSALEQERQRRDQVQARLYWRCKRRAHTAAWTISVLVVALLLLGLVAGGFGLRAHGAVSWLFFAAAAALLIATLANLLVGATIRGLHGWLTERLMTWLLRREASATGLDLETPR